MVGMAVKVLKHVPAWERPTGGCRPRTRGVRPTAYLHSLILLPVGVALGTA